MTLHSHTVSLVRSDNAHSIYKDRSYRSDQLLAKKVSMWCIHRAASVLSDKTDYCTTFIWNEEGLKYYPQSTVEYGENDESLDVNVMYNHVLQLENVLSP